MSNGIVQKFLSDERNLLNISNGNILRKFYYHRGSDFISIQALINHRCVPTDNLIDGSYESVEIFSSFPIKAFEYYLCNNQIPYFYEYVPVELANKILMFYKS